MADLNPNFYSGVVKHCEYCGDEFRRSATQDGYHFRKKRFCTPRCAAFGSAKPALSLEERLWQHTTKAEGCWLWTGHRAKAGYGVFSYQNKFVGAHRVSYELYCGPITNNMHVCHSCDTPACVNPDHLFLGTAKENMHDMIRKGRARLRVQKGTQHGCAKLTDDQVAEIRSSSDSGPKCGERFGVTATQIYNIRNRKSWRHLP